MTLRGIAIVVVHSERDGCEQVWGENEDAIRGRVYIGDYEDKFENGPRDSKAFVIARGKLTVLLHGFSARTAVR